MGVKLQISHVFFALGFVLVSACGRSTCTYSVVESRTIQRGPNETLICPDTEVILSVTPIYLPGGTVTRIDVKCGRSVVACT